MLVPYIFGTGTCRLYSSVFLHCYVKFACADIHLNLFGLTYTYRWLSARLQYLHWRYYNLALNHRYHIRVWYYKISDRMAFWMMKWLCKNVRRGTPRALFAWLCRYMLSGARRWGFVRLVTGSEVTDWFLGPQELGGCQQRIITTTSWRLGSNQRAERVAHAHTSRSDPSANSYHCPPWNNHFTRLMNYGGALS